LCRRLAACQSVTLPEPNMREQSSRESMLSTHRASADSFIRSSSRPGSRGVIRSLSAVPVIHGTATAVQVGQMRLSRSRGVTDKAHSRATASIAAALATPHISGLGVYTVVSLTLGICRLSDNWQANERRADTVVRWSIDQDASVLRKVEHAVSHISFRRH
jgi:hypothetical protein